MNNKAFNNKTMKLVLMFLIISSTFTHLSTVGAKTNTTQGNTKSLSPVVKNKELQTIKLQDKTFLTSKQRSQLYQLLIDFIETYDAEGIATRNFSKKTQWQEYKKIKRRLFVESNSWKDLKTAFDQFAAGFVNLHSHFSFNPSLQETLLRSSIKIGFTYPEITFFNRDNLQTISKINQKTVTSIFNDFEQNNCRFNSTIGCLYGFIGGFYRGKILINEEPIKNMTSAGKTTPINYIEKTPDTNKVSKRYQSIDVSNYNDWELLAKGHKVAILKQANNLLLVIKNFKYHKTGGDFRCNEPANELTMCSDIQLIRQIFNQMNVDDKNLIINVQNNSGGKENTPFLAELSQAPFKDLAVQYKNTPLLDDKQMRTGLFYGSDRAESWYQNLTPEEKDMKNEWLPVRADFCRADELCQLEWIMPNSNRKFKNIYILTNDACGSSCDDLVWRMNEFSGAIVTGMPQAADATYSRVSAGFYLDLNDQIKYVLYADGEQPSFQGVLLFNITIPYSKTLTASGEIRQGRAASTHFLLPITKENFSTYPMESLKELVRLINSDQL